ncbi:hypothetical protein AV530_014798 [Patagioenas fasciata monilis]|uniref:EGF-like domain-containing protein n=1 Tax=Patagioenas fasciata monilis TaxID=372326 RepID=A0A1V4L0G9_PATFA|nr:hypothetical protein AV530_014798 [Patagioenas fasciata monilis]
MDLQFAYSYSVDVFCGFLLCTNLTKVPRVGQVQGEIIPSSFYHQGRIVDCSGAHVLLDDDTDLGYVEDGAPCGPHMMCLDKKCLPIQSLNITSCPIGSSGKVCSGHGVCSNEATCICNSSWAGTDCSINDPIRDSGGKKEEGPKEMSKNEGSIQLNKALSEEMRLKSCFLHYWILAQIFWDIYVDCMLSRTHGLGRRQLAEAEQKIATLPSQFTGRNQGMFSRIQRSPVLKKKESLKDLTSIHVHTSRSTLLGKIVGELGKKRKQHI